MTSCFIELVFLFFFQVAYFGKGLVDIHHVIIHHFRESPEGFSYPDFAAGVVFSVPLLKRFMLLPFPENSDSIDLYCGMRCALIF